MRIDKYIGNSTHYSRKELKGFFKKGLVRLNGEVVTDIGTHIDEETAVVTLSGERASERIVDEVFSHFCVGK